MTIIPTISSAMSDMYSDSCICCGFTTTCTCVCYTCNHVPDTFNAHLYVHEHPGHLCPVLDGVVVHGVVHCVHGMVVCGVVCGIITCIHITTVFFFRNCVKMTWLLTFAS